MMKRLSALLLSLIIIILPLCNINYSFAEDSNNNSEWTYISDADPDMQDTFFVSAFKAYMNANNTFNQYSYAAEVAIVNWTYDNLNQIAIMAGFNGIEDYYDKIAMAVDSNGYFKFWYTASGVQFMDDLYKAYLQHYGILTDDEEKRIFDGEYFLDDNSNGCYITEIYQTGTNINYANINNYAQLGTPYRFYGDDHFNLGNASFTYICNYNNLSLSYKITNSQTNYYKFSYIGTDNSGDCYIYFNSADSNYVTYKKGFVTICKYQNKYYIGSFCNFTMGGNNLFNIGYKSSYLLNSPGIHDQAIDLAKIGADNANLALANNAVINVGKMGADIGVAAVNHITDQDQNEPEVETPEDDPPVNNPKVNIPVGIVNNMPISISLPNLDDLIPDPIPQIPHGFTIPGLRYKFPFCIPFDLIAVYEVLDTTPEAPHFETEINFATFNYDLDIDLQDYDPYMVHIRNYFLILYIFGLLFITPKLLKA